MFEQLRFEFLERRPWIAFFIGAIYVIIAFLTSKIFFPSILSIATLFLITLLLVPTVIKLLGAEETRERKDGLKHFIKDHKDIFEIYICLFAGIFVGSLLVGSFTDMSSFDYQINFLERQEGLSSELVQNKLSTGVTTSVNAFFGLLENNLLVILIAFALSLFYGAGAMFLIVLNASIFSTFALFVMKELPTMTHKLTLFAIFSVHMIPELIGFLLAAVAGGIVSKAVMQERFMGHEFKNVMKDAFGMFVLAAVIILVAAAMEAFVTPALFNHFLVGQ